MNKERRPLHEYGLICPLCRSWYSTSKEMLELGIVYKVGEICGNQAFRGPNPELCSPKHPCKGRLAPKVPYISPF